MDPDSPENPSESNLITITNQNLGRLTVGEDRLITFRLGLWGFVKFRRHTFIHRPQELPFGWLEKFSGGLRRGMACCATVSLSWFRVCRRHINDWFLISAWERGLK